MARTIKFSKEDILEKSVEFIKKKGLPYVSTTNKSMMITMPLIMAIFTIFYNAAFGIYIVAGSLFSFITTPLVTLVVDKIFEAVLALI